MLRIEVMVKGQTKRTRITVKITRTRPAPRPVQDILDLLEE